MEAVIITRVKEYVQDAAFPISKKKIITYAKMHHVPENLLQTLEELPERSYKNFKEIEVALKPLPFDDGTPKKTKDALLQKKEDQVQHIPNLVNPSEFTQMGDEENYEN